SKQEANRKAVLLPCSHDFSRCWVVRSNRYHGPEIFFFRKGQYRAFRFRLKNSARLAYRQSASSCAARNSSRDSRLVLAGGFGWSCFFCATKNPFVPRFVASRINGQVNQLYAYPGVRCLLVVVYLVSATPLFISLPVDSSRVVEPRYV